MANSRRRTGPFTGGKSASRSPPVGGIRLRRRRRRPGHAVARLLKNGGSHAEHPGIPLAHFKKFSYGISAVVVLVRGPRGARDHDPGQPLRKLARTCGCAIVPPSSCDRGEPSENLHTADCRRAPGSALCRGRCLRGTPAGGRRSKRRRGADAGAQVGGVGRELLLGREMNGRRETEARGMKGSMEGEASA